MNAANTHDGVKTVLTQGRSPAAELTLSERIKDKDAVIAEMSGPVSGLSAAARGCLPDLRGPAPPGTAPRRTAESPKYVQYEGDSTARRGTAPDAAV
ncbi:hypothetical protein [Streptomyces sp. NPDC005435]|uniref:hypothetical protein n=1 Tax=Streptomyces sp. NPDC005435 TaxID=3154464 RepID=UPI0034530A69